MCACSCMHSCVLCWWEMSELCDISSVKVWIFYFIFLVLKWWWFFVFVLLASVECWVQFCWTIVLKLTPFHVCVFDWWEMSGFFDITAVKVWVFWYLTIGLELTSLFWNRGWLSLVSWNSENSREGEVLISILFIVWFSRDFGIETSNVYRIYELMFLLLD